MGMMFESSREKIEEASKLIDYNFNRMRNEGREVLWVDELLKGTGVSAQCSNADEGIDLGRFGFEDETNKEKEILSLKKMAADNYYNYALKTLVSDLGFGPVGDYDETYELNKVIRFEKQAEGSIHQVLLEDHREDEDIKDWLIFSELKDDETDWFGRKISTPYPLTLSELTAFEMFIRAFQNYKEVVEELCKKENT